MEITYKEFFEKAKTGPLLQNLIAECLVRSVKVALLGKKVFPDKPQADSGELMLNALDTICEMVDITLTNREEITAEYMAKILNSYKNRHNNSVQPTSKVGG